MNWFSGRLEIIYESGVHDTHFDISFKEASELIQNLCTPLDQAMYYPYPTQLTKE
jgi:hypothetical protein